MAGKVPRKLQVKTPSGQRKRMQNLGTAGYKKSFDPSYRQGKTTAFGGGAATGQHKYRPGRNKEDARFGTYSSGKKAAFALREGSGPGKKLSQSKASHEPRPMQGDRHTCRICGRAIVFNPKAPGKAVPGKYRHL